MKVAPGEDTSRQNASSAEQPSGSHDFPLAWQQPLLSNGSIVINAGVRNLLLSSYSRDIHFLTRTTAATPPQTGLTEEFSPKTRKKKTGEFLLH